MQDSEVWNLCEEYFEWRLLEYPEFSTFCGLHDCDHRLNIHSSEAFAQRLVSFSSVSFYFSSVLLSDLFLYELMLLGTSNFLRLFQKTAFEDK